MTARRPRDGRPPYRPPVGATVTPTGGHSMSVAIEGESVYVEIAAGETVATAVMPWHTALTAARSLMEAAAYTSAAAGVTRQDFGDGVLNVFRALTDGDT